MSNICFNVAKGRIAELYARVKGNDPAASVLVLCPIETTGLESDATLIDADTFAVVISGTTNIQATMGKKTLTDADLAAVPAPNDAGDYNELSLPTVTWTGATGSAISKICVCYCADVAGVGTDSNLVPLTMFDFAQTPSGSDIQMTTGAFFRAT